ncbi:MAG: TrkH family potassium uptake protein [Deltaproteobacteria bacterium]|nr:TrkH family potassium uptake protein [Deltaproteobacteria bacterium]
MNWRLVLRILGTLMLVLAAAMAVPLVLALCLGEPDVPALLVGFTGAVVPGLGLSIGYRRETNVLGPREALVVVALAWITAIVLGALPYRLWALLHVTPGLDTVSACIFEAASGFSTTGATVLGDVEALPHGLKLWRASTQWLGGMGIIVLFVALLPSLGIGARGMFQAEVPGLVKRKFTPRLKDTARLLWISYTLLSAGEVLALRLAGLGWFDAICHTFTTMATGGFSTRNAGVMGFDSVAVEMVLVVFMVLAGLNFALHVGVFRNGPGIYLRDPEARSYLGLLLSLSVALAAALWLGGAFNLAGSLRFAVFQVVSLTTTTGFHSADFEAWRLPLPFTSVLLLLAMFVGGCSGSTAGSMKVARIVVSSKLAWRELARLAHPRGVFPIRMGPEVVPESQVSLVSGFVVLYLGFFALGVLLLAATGQDLVTSIAATAASIGNVGPGFGEVGPTLTYAGFGPVGQWVLIFEMLLGRLELFTVLVLLSKAFWQR